MFFFVFFVFFFFLGGGWGGEGRVLIFLREPIHEFRSPNGDLKKNLSLESCRMLIHHFVHHIIT